MSNRDELVLGVVEAARAFMGLFGPGNEHPSGERARAAEALDAALGELDAPAPAEAWRLSGVQRASPEGLHAEKVREAFKGTKSPVARLTNLHSELRALADIVGEVAESQECSARIHLELARRVEMLERRVHLTPMPRCRNCTAPLNEAVYCSELYCSSECGDADARDALERAE